MLLPWRMPVSHQTPALTVQTLVACLCSQLSLLSELGFGGVLLYVDPCDAPLDRHTWHQAFRVTLNPGGNPASSKTLCVKFFFFFFFEKLMKICSCLAFNYSEVFLLHLHFGGLMKGTGTKKKMILKVHFKLLKKKKPRK